MKATPHLPPTHLSQLPPKHQRPHFQALSIPLIDITNSPLIYKRTMRRPPRDPFIAIKTLNRHHLIPLLSLHPKPLVATLLPRRQNTPRQLLAPILDIQHARFDKVCVRYG